MGPIDRYLLINDEIYDYCLSAKRVLMRANAYLHSCCSSSLRGLNGGEGHALLTHTSKGQQWDRSGQDVGFESQCILFAFKIFSYKDSFIRILKLALSS
jgi:hypothetical protein